MSLFLFFFLSQLIVVLWKVSFLVPWAAIQPLYISSYTLKDNKCRLIHVKPPYNVCVEESWNVYLLAWRVYASHARLIWSLKCEWELQLYVIIVIIKFRVAWTIHHHSEAAHIFCTSSDWVDECACQGCGAVKQWGTRVLKQLYWSRECTKHVCDVKGSERNDESKPTDTAEADELRITSVR